MPLQSTVGTSGLQVGEDVNKALGLASLHVGHHTALPTHFVVACLTSL